MRSEVLAASMALAACGGSQRAPQNECQRTIKETDAFFYQLAQDFPEGSSVTPLSPQHPVCEKLPLMKNFQVRLLTACEAPTLLTPHEYEDFSVLSSDLLWVIEQCDPPKTEPQEKKGPGPAGPPYYDSEIASIDKLKHD